MLRKNKDPIQKKSTNNKQQQNATTNKQQQTTALERTAAEATLEGGLISNPGVSLLEFGMTRPFPQWRKMQS